MRELNLFITGLGNVGSELLSLITRENKYSQKFKINVIGISNSKFMFFDKKGVDLANWKSLLINGEKNNRDQFFDRTIKFNLSNIKFTPNTMNANRLIYWGQLKTKGGQIIDKLFNLEIFMPSYNLKPIVSVSISETLELNLVIFSNSGCFKFLNNHVLGFL